MQYSVDSTSIEYSHSELDVEEWEAEELTLYRLLIERINVGYSITTVLGNACEWIECIHDGLKVHFQHLNKESENDKCVVITGTARYVSMFI